MAFVPGFAFGDLHCSADVVLSLDLTRLLIQVSFALVVVLATVASQTRKILASLCFEGWGEPFARKHPELQKLFAHGTTRLRLWPCHVVRGPAELGILVHLRWLLCVPSGQNSNAIIF